MNDKRKVGKKTDGKNGRGPWPKVDSNGLCKKKTF